MSEKRLIVGIALLTFFILGIGLFFLSDTTSGPVSSSKNSRVVSINAKASVSEVSADLGNIPMNGGLVTKTFTIKNSGKESLKLFDVRTSCHCTKVIISINNNDSPEFGMSIISSWVGDVMPGKEAKVKVIFDPLYHGINGLGPINRYVEVKTNDKSNEKFIFTITGVVYK